MKSKYRIIINPFAELDLKASVEFFEFQKPGLENEFIKEVDDVIKRIELNPKMFPKIRKVARRALLTRFPFGIYYVVKDDLINIFAVFHFSRDPKKLRKRS